MNAKRLSCKVLLQMDKALTFDIEPDIYTEYTELLGR